jgi:hypothetical protein
MKLIKLLGSLPFAVLLISGFAGILILSTSVESLHGTPVAKAAFYEAQWFNIFLGLVWVNIFCATLSRWPFKKRHTGFVITHIGILTLLIGTLVTRLVASEGQMTLLENEQWDRLQQEGLNLITAPEDGAGYEFRLPERSTGKPRRLKTPDAKLELYFEEKTDHAGSKLIVKNRGESFNPAVQFTLSSQRAGVRQQVWLVTRDLENPFSDETQLGPARFRIVDADEATEVAAHAELRPADKPAHLILSDKAGKPIGHIDLPADKSETEFVIDDGRLTLTDLRFLPYALVEENRLINQGEDRPDRRWNPAVEFTVRDASGASEKHTRFALFPEFDSLHGKDTPNIFDLKVDLHTESPEDAAAAAPSGPELIFEAHENAPWTWRSVKTDGTIRTGTFRRGETFETGWMDMQVHMDRVVPRAVLSRQIGLVAADAHDAEVGARVSYTDKEGVKQEGWILLSKPLRIETPAGRWTLSLSDHSLKLPFMLQLKDFRKIDYPGTNNPASFESDVTLFDAAKGIRIDRTIKMNEPLDYAGWRIFQSSYIQDPQYGEASVFTIAKNPGIPLTYGGLIILLCGVITMFYVKPFGSGSHVH